MYSVTVNTFISNILRNTRQKMEHRGNGKAATYTEVTPRFGKVLPQTAGI